MLIIWKYFVHIKCFHVSTCIYFCIRYHFQCHSFDNDTVRLLLFTENIHTESNANASYIYQQNIFNMNSNLYFHTVTDPTTWHVCDVNESGIFLFYLIAICVKTALIRKDNLNSHIKSVTFFSGLFFFFSPIFSLPWCFPWRRKAS